jgi:hypothetical protein
MLIAIQLKLCRFSLPVKCFRAIISLAQNRYPEFMHQGETP